MVSSLMESAKTLVFFANIQFILKFERGHLIRARTIYETAVGSNWISSRHLMGGRVLAFRQNCSEVRAKHILLAAKM